MLLFLLLTSVLAGGGGPSRHPSDGPDADVRIQVEPERVRFFLTLNLAFVDAIVDVPREADDDLHPVEAPWVREALVEHFAESLLVELDGQAVTGVDAGFELLEPDLTLLPLYPNMGKRALVKMQLLLDFPAAEAPERVHLVWGSFPVDLAVASGDFRPPVIIRAQLFSGGIVTPVELTVTEPGYTWHATGKTASDLMLPVPQTVPPEPVLWPMLSSVLVLAAVILVLRQGLRPAPLLQAGGAIALAVLLRGQARVPLPIHRGPELPSPEEAAAIFQPLHANVYRAFDYTSESEIYDALARSVDGALLEELYGQVYRGLIQQEQGGAVSRVQEVRPLELEVGTIGQLPEDGRLGFTVDARWQVDGRVTHWGHSHDRTNEYRARYAVIRTPEGWRIGGSQILESLTIAATPEGAGG